MAPVIIKKKSSIPTLVIAGADIRSTDNVKKQLAELIAGTPQADAPKLSKKERKAARLAAKDVAAAAAKAAEAPKNDAIQALVAGSEKRSKKDRAKEVAKEIDTSLGKLKLSANDALMNATRAYMDTEVKEVAEAFTMLYIARTNKGDAPEAIRALEACRVAFESAGLILADVETQAPKSTKVDAPKAQPKPKKKVKKGTK